jgi:predicted nucleotidyltransferase
MKFQNLEFEPEAVGSLCRKWNISRLDLFGSALRDDFGPQSDIDLLVEFEPGAHVSLIDLDRAEMEFARVFGRRVELVSRRGIEASQNWIRRRNILDSAVMLFAA